ncbi:hypothetical protein SAMN03097699_3224 [Flavobacteriaceae bacterium MAR_2010_188]|nr:hypothetical protein SAMN03097699_3224 [Flavobacteriaceae bacterium MAR_2010_188]
MNTPPFKNVFWSICLLTFILCVSCSEDNNTNDEPQTDVSDIILALQVDEIETLTADFIIAAFQIQQASEVNRTSERLTDLPNCINVTIMTEQNSREIKLDFGSGCATNGHEIRGSLNISYTINPDDTDIVITADSDNFYIDGRLIEGTRTILRELINGEDAPRYTHTSNIQVTSPNGFVAQREGVIIRDWVEGYETADLSDNVVEISGNWTITFPNGNEHFYEVLSALRHEYDCPYFVSGEVLVKRTYFGGILDFGTDECDNRATFTFNDGEVRDITLN